MQEEEEGGVSLRFLDMHKHLDRKLTGWNLVEKFAYAVDCKRGMYKKGCVNLALVALLTFIITLFCTFAKWHFSLSLVLLGNAVVFLPFSSFEGRERSAFYGIL